VSAWIDLGYFVAVAKTGLVRPDASRALPILRGRRLHHPARLVLTNQAGTMWSAR
jgi:hypothetical protein